MMVVKCKCGVEVMDAYDCKNKEEVLVNTGSVRILADIGKSLYGFEFHVCEYYDETLALIREELYGDK